MSNIRDMGSWPDKIRQRYESYLKTSFFFKDPGLRASFQTALREEVLNRKGRDGDRAVAEPLGIALCRECGQHYYVGRGQDGMLREAIRDPSHSDFGVEYYLPTGNGDQLLCRRCGALSGTSPTCGCGATVRVRRCANHKDHPDQLKRCEACRYRRGSIGDPVQEIVHGSDGPNAVIATALHELLPEARRKVLAFADSRQEAAFFAWYAENSYEKLRDRNLILRAIKAQRRGTPTAGPVQEGRDPPAEFVNDIRGRCRSWRSRCGVSSQRAAGALQLHATRWAGGASGDSRLGSHLLPPKST